MTEQQVKENVNTRPFFIYFCVSISLTVLLLAVTYLISRPDEAEQFRHLNRFVSVPFASARLWIERVEDAWFVLSIGTIGLGLWGITRGRNRALTFRLFPRLIVSMSVFCFFYYPVMQMGVGVNTRVRLGLVGASTKTLQIAIESYRSVNDVYPAWGDKEQGINYYLGPNASAYHIPTFRRTENATGRASFVLTTPVEYMLPDIDFHTDQYAVGNNKGALYGYYSNESWFVLFSPGPDLQYNVQVAEDFVSTSTLARAWCLKSYDPTNGILSGGDVLCTSIDGDKNFRALLGLDH